MNFLRKCHNIFIETTSFINSHEANSCVLLCKKLVETGLPQDTIAVLTLYQAQKFIITSKLENDDSVKVFITHDLKE